MPAMTGRPDRISAGPRAPDESTMVGRRASGMPSAASTSVSHPEPSLRTSPVTPALDESVTCSRPPVRVQATQVSTVPKASSPRSDRARSGSAESSSAATLVAEALGATRMPFPWSSRHVPTVRRSCQPRPGPTGTPVDRSHTMVEARWLAMPTASTGPPSARLAEATSTTASAMAVASNSTSPGNGVSGSTGTWWMCSTLPSGRTTAPRTPEVPTSTTRMLTARAPGRRASRGRACRG
jgi:hypothetical protein